MGNLFSELKRRNVVRVGIAYLVIGWVLIEVSDTIAPMMSLPEWAPSLILYVLILGLPVALFLSWAYELTPQGVKKTEEVDRDESITPSTGRKLDFVIIAGLAVALGYFVWESRFAGEDAATGAEQTAEAPATVAKSIAVLPFVNISSDPEQEYFSDGISEELLNALAKVPGLRVAARTSSFQFKGQNQDIQMIGQRLNVATILEGSVRKSGTKLRITAQLIDVEKGFHLWSETYDRELTDIFAIQDEISKAIVDALKVSLDLGGNEKLLNAGTDNLEAYNAFLQGRYLFLRRGGRGLLQAGRYFEEAIALDDQFAAAYANLALTFSVGWGERDESRARPAAERAIALAPNSSLAWTAKAMVLEFFDWNHEESRAAFERAIALDANNSDAHHALATQHFIFGRVGKAIELEEKAIGLNPAAFIMRFWLSRFYQVEADLEKALGELQAAVELRPEWPIGQQALAILLLRLDRSQEAEAAMKEVDRLASSPFRALTSRAEFLFAAGKKEAAAKLARQALALMDEEETDAIDGIGIALIAGDVELSNSLIEEAFRLHHTRVPFYRYPSTDIPQETLAKTRFWELMRENGFVVENDE